MSPFLNRRNAIREVGLEFFAVPGFISIQDGLKSLTSESLGEYTPHPYSYNEKSNHDVLYKRIKSMKGIFSCSFERTRAFKVGGVWRGEREIIQFENVEKTLDIGRPVFFGTFKNNRIRSARVVSSPNVWLADDETDNVILGNAYSLQFTRWQFESSAPETWEGLFSSENIVINESNEDDLILRFWIGGPVIWHSEEYNIRCEFESTIKGKVTNFTFKSYKDSPQFDPSGNLSVENFGETSIKLDSGITLTEIPFPSSEPFDAITEKEFSADFEIAETF